MTPSADPGAIPPRPLRLAVAAGIAGAVAALVALLFVAISSAATPGKSGGTALDIWHLVRMTTIQAGLSTLLSLVVGTALAWALNRLRFVGRTLLVALFASAIVTPGLVVAFGLLAIWGRSGWIGTLHQWLLGTPLNLSIFGLGGILAAHVILDGAFAARILLARLDTIPQKRLKTGQSLGLNALQRFTIIDWPTIRGTLPALAAIIFLLAFTSFPIVLLLGGGPANQTLEVAIYAAVRLDFDLSAAVTLALVQIAICGVIILSATAFAPIPAATGTSAPQSWRDANPARLAQWAVLWLGTLGFGLPLLAVLIEGFGPGLLTLVSSATFWQAAGTSLWVGLASAATTLAMALGLSLGRAASAKRLLRIGLGVPAYTYLAVPAMVLALGFFLLVRNLGIAPASAAAPVVVIANGLLALPFAIATLGPPLDAIAKDRGRLIRSLGLSGLQQFFHIEWPLLGREIGVVIALGFCFSLGDLGVISLFGTQDFTTLPLLMLRALGAYRSSDAAAIAAIMLVGAIIAFAGLPALFERLARARA